MGRKPLLGVAGALLTGLALAGCNNGPNKADNKQFTPPPGSVGQNSSTVKPGMQSNGNAGMAGMGTNNGLGTNAGMPSNPNNGLANNGLANNGLGSNAGMPSNPNVGFANNPQMPPNNLNNGTPSRIGAANNSNLTTNAIPDYKVGTTGPTPSTAFQPVGGNGGSVGGLQQSNRNPTPDVNTPYPSNRPTMSGSSGSSLMIGGDTVPSAQPTPGPVKNGYNTAAPIPPGSPTGSPPPASDLYPSIPALPPVPPPPSSNGVPGLPSH
jgi:hypothetical protein